MTRQSAHAIWLALTWTALLATLAALWVRSPFLGERAAFLVWSGPAAVLLIASVRWFRSRGIHQIPDSPGLWVSVTVVWLLALWLIATDLGRVMALDGLIMRNPGLRRLGQALRWAPMVFGCGVSLAGFTASLEARYWILNGPRSSATSRE